MTGTGADFPRVMIGNPKTDSEKVIPAFGTALGCSCINVHTPHLVDQDIRASLFAWQVWDIERKVMRALRSN